jgi:hypothetical protein
LEKKERELPLHLSKKNLVKLKNWSDLIYFKLILSFILKFMKQEIQDKN